MRPLYFSPSLLSANFANLDLEIKKAKNSGADYLHFDVMDGHFVPNLTFGPKIIGDLKKITSLPLDVHLMITNAESSWKSYADAGAHAITFHWEAVTHHNRLAGAIKSEGVKVGVSIVPSTPVAVLTELLRDVDLVLIMSVNPGFGGQVFLEQSVDRIKKLDQIRKEKGYSYKISVDGGINLDTAPLVIGAGVDIIVSGSAFFDAQNPESFVRSMKGEKII